MTVSDDELAVLRGIGRALRARIEALDPVSLAWCQLWDAEEMHPWTARAAQHWQRLSGNSHVAAEDCWQVHHLAVLHHAWAYDTENADPPQQAQALSEWEKALGYWAQLHASDTFWAELGQYLDRATAGQVPVEALVAMRERLPGDLLAVHTALAAEHRRKDPSHAAEHLRLVTRSRFPAAAIAAARRELVADLDNTIAKKIEHVEHEEAFAVLAGWLAIDPTNPWLLRNLLYVTDSWAKYLNKKPEWIDAVTHLLNRTEKFLSPAQAERGDSRAVLASELARYEFWRGFCRLCTLPRDHTSASSQELQSRLRRTEVAVFHLRKSLDLDPSLRLLYYYEAGLQLARALTIQAELKLLLGWERHEVEHDLTEADQHHPDLPETRELHTLLRSLRGRQGSWR